MNRYLISNNEKERMLHFLEIMERNPKAAVTEGWRRCANLFDTLDFIYSSCSSGKDSMFTSQMILMELQRRKMIVSMLESGDEDEAAKAESLMDRYNAVRKSGLASQRENVFDTNEHYMQFKKWENMRIAILQMNYEMEYDQSGQVMQRFYKEYATDIRNVLPKPVRDKYLIGGKYAEGSDYDLVEPSRWDESVWDDPVWNSEKSVGELGFDLRWVNKEEKKFNPHELDYEQIAKMTPENLKEVYGKALVWAWDMCQPIAWESNMGVTDSRYISFEPAAKKIWVNDPPTAYDPHHEWVVTLENMYDSWHGLAPNLACTPGMSDQLLRVEFSRFISDVLPEALARNWPEKKYNAVSGKYE